MIKTVTFVGLTFVGAVVSFGLFAKLCEVTGFLDLVGWTYQGTVKGALCLIGVGLISTLYLARDVATWSLKGLSPSEWPEDGDEVMRRRVIDLPRQVEEVLAASKWRWREPRIRVFPSNELNAIGLSVGRNRSLILLSTAIIEDASEEELKAALRHSILRLKSGKMTGILVMYGLMIAMTLFPARMMALILGTALRSADEETPSDEVETLILVLHEVCLVALGSLSMRYFVRDTLAFVDKQLEASHEMQAWIDLLKKDTKRRKVAHRERFTAPFVAFDKTRRVFPFWSYVNAAEKRRESLNQILEAHIIPAKRSKVSID